MKYSKYISFLLALLVTISTFAQNIDARQIKLQTLTPSNSTVAAGDNLEAAIGKAQGQITPINTRLQTETQTHLANTIAAGGTSGCQPLSLQ
jgi:hypothetical protein